jgi:hypothetical protein
MFRNGEYSVAWLSMESIQFDPDIFKTMKCLFGPVDASCPLWPVTPNCAVWLWTLAGLGCRLDAAGNPNVRGGFLDIVYPGSKKEIIDKLEKGA